MHIYLHNIQIFGGWKGNHWNGMGWDGVACQLQKREEGSVKTLSPFFCLAPSTSPSSCLSLSLTIALNYSLQSFFVDVWKDGILYYYQNNNNNNTLYYILLFPYSPPQYIFIWVIISSSPDINNIFSGHFTLFCKEKESWKNKEIFSRLQMKMRRRKSLQTQEVVASCCRHRISSVTQHTTQVTAIPCIFPFILFYSTSETSFWRISSNLCIYNAHSLYEIYFCFFLFAFHSYKFIILPNFHTYMLCRYGWFMLKEAEEIM